MTRQRYKVDFPAHMAECDSNFVRVTKLLPDLAETDHWHFGLTLPSGESAKVAVQVVERCRYTTTVAFEQRGLMAWPNSQVMTVRIYHDAKTVEVIACQRGRHFEPKYEYPNKAMYQRDEKLQLNRFLGEWLNYCLSYGHSLQVFVSA